MNKLDGIDLVCSWYRLEQFEITAILSTEIVKNEPIHFATDDMTLGVLQRSILPYQENSQFKLDHFITLMAT